MAAVVERSRDVAGGVLIAAVGVGFLLAGRDLPMGSASRMGPGYFPTVLSCLMIALGAVLTLLALRKPAAAAPDAGGGEGEVGRLPWAGLLLIIGAVVFFGLTMRGIGLAPAILLVVLATAWASRYASLRSSVPLALGLAAFCVLLFIRGLGLPLPIVGPWLSAAYWSRPPASAPAAAPAAATPPAVTQ